MKTKKLIAASALALSMTFAPAVSMLNAMPVMAETVDNATDHAYKAYQVFSGTQADDDAALGEVAWGSAINVESIKTLLADSETFKSANGDAGKVAEILAATSGNGAANEFAKIAEQSLKSNATSVEIAANATSVELSSGYYLLVDQTTSSNVENGYKNLSLLQVTKSGNITIQKKNDIPTVDKKVQDETTEDGNDVTDTGSEYYYNADHAIGEEFKFQLTGTVPANTMNLYDSYYFQFNDA